MVRSSSGVVVVVVVVAIVVIVWSAYVLVAQGSSVCVVLSRGNSHELVVPVVGGVWNFPGQRNILLSNSEELYIREWKRERQPSTKFETDGVERFVGGR